MQYLDLTFPTPAENLACDEALLELCENSSDLGILRFWEPQDYFIVLGYSNKIKEQIIVDTCQQLNPVRPIEENENIKINSGRSNRVNIPVLRRITGGGTVVQGPGCLNYSLILKIAHYPSLKFITSTNSWIMNSHKRILEPVLGKEIQVQGHSDLTFGTLKFSGNSQKRKKDHLLFHGTFLLDFDIPLIDKLLQIPDKQPLYRHHRPHSDFLTNLHIPATSIKLVLRNFWKATKPFHFTPSDTFYHLVKAKYSSPTWNQKL